MSREIKFRGKRIDNNEWVYGSLIIDEITGKYYITLSVEESEKVGEEGCLKVVSCEIIPETVGQYIGITDINNEEIYEDDIVSQESNIPYSLLFIIGYINFLYGQFVITSSLGNSELNSFTTTIKILGNRFDNP